MIIENIFSNIPNTISNEIFDRIIQIKNITIERILSKGHASPTNFWYDQEKNEWVIVLKGHARLKFEDEIVEMKPGDYITIPVHCKHRVEWTDPKKETIWLAVYY
jgi:cupin 2 domain-containing protein